MSHCCGSHSKPRNRHIQMHNDLEKKPQKSFISRFLSNIRNNDSEKEKPVKEVQNETLIKSSSL